MDAIAQRLADGTLCLEAALEYLGYGWSALCLCPPDHAGVGKAHGAVCSSFGKVPLGTWKEFQTRLPTEDELRRKWRENANANVGMAYGPVSGLIGVDVDGEAGEKILREFSDGFLPDTLEFSTPGGGRRLLFAIPANVRLQTTFESPAPGQELRFQARGSQTVMPPSRHKNGGVYAWRSGHSPREISPTSAPAWLLRELTPTRAGGGATAPPLNGTIAEGTRDATLTSLAGTMRRRGMSADAIQAAIAVENRERCSPPLPDAQVEKIARSVSRYTPDEETSAPLNGEANGVLLPRAPAASLAAFPLHCFPPILGRFAYEVSGALSCPVDFPAVAMLAVAATAIGASRAVMVKRRWVECPRIYLALVSDPGSAKTPAFKLACDPLYSHQLAIKRTWDERMEEYRRAQEQYDAIKTRRDSTGMPVKPIRPVLRSLYTTDATTEALVPLLAENPRGLALIQDEVTAWVLGLNQYKGGKGSDRQFWLKAWSGEAARIDRKASHESGPIIVPHPFINVFGGIQPDMLNELCDEKAREDGFIHRILFAFPEPRWGDEWTETVPSKDAEDAWKATILALLDLEMTEGENGERLPKILRLSSDAKLIWREWYNQHAREMRDPDFQKDLIGPWSKMRSYVARIALVIHLVRWTCAETGEGEIDADSMVRAAAVVSYFKSHTGRVYGAIKDRPEDARAVAAFDWINRHGGTCKARDLQTNHVANVRKSSEAHKLIEDLVDRGYGRLEGKVFISHSSAGTKTRVTNHSAE